MSNKDWDPNLTPEQNYILRQEGTESPGSSSLNNEKREGSYFVLAAELNSLSLKLNTTVDQVGLLFMMLYQEYLKLKQICTLVILALSIIVKNVVVIMDIFLKMDLSKQVKDIVTMELV